MNKEENKNSCCGNGHGHKHSHDEACCNGVHKHDHKHEHNCEEHNHNHEHGCCGHNHSHEHSCCGHDHSHQEVPMMTIMFDDGKETNCVVLALFEFEGDKFIILLPEDAKEYLVYYYIEKDDSFTLENIEDETKFNKVIEFINSDEYEQ